MIGIVHEDGKDKIDANITSLMKLPKGMTAPVMVNASVQLNLAEFNQDVFDSLSENLRITIAKSPECGIAKGRDGRAKYA